MSYIRKTFKEKDVLADKKASIATFLRDRADRRIRDANILRRLYKEKKEVEMEEAITKAQESAGWRADELKQEERLALCLDNAKKGAIRDHKLRQLLLDSREIKELEKTLKLAYYQKELADRRNETSYAKEIQKMEDEAYKERLRIEEQRRETGEKLLRERNELKKQTYKEQLQDQIIDNHKLRILENQKKLKETALINDAVRTAMEEDERLEEEIQRRKEHVKEEIRSFQKARAFWAQREKEIEEDEERKLVEYLEERKNRETSMQQQNLERENAKLRKQEAVIQRVKEMEGVRKERERISQILSSEETRLKSENEERLRMEKAMRFKQDSRRVFLAQLQHKIVQKEEEKQLDKLYALQLKQKIEEDRRKEMEEQERARIKKYQYGEELRRGLEEHHRQKFMDLLLSIKEEEGLQAEKERHIQLVNEERRRLLNEHVPHLVGFLPAGTIKDDDVPHLKSDLLNMLKIQ